MFVGIKSYFSAVAAYHPTINNGEIVWIKLITVGSHSVFTCSSLAIVIALILLSICVSPWKHYYKESSSSFIILGGDFNSLAACFMERGMWLAM